MPKNFLEEGKNPGLGIRDLHKRGFTGKGVKVAIIDQKLRLTHIEYKDRIERYIESENIDEHPSMHGSAVSSLLCGADCGVGGLVSAEEWFNEYDYCESILVITKMLLKKQITTLKRLIQI